MGGNSLPPSGRNCEDISRMPDNLPKHLGHRRAHSELLTLPDDISFHYVSDETEEDLVSMYLDMDKFNSSSAVQTSEAAAPAPEPLVQSSGERPRVRHQHSQSMDGSATNTIKPADAKKSVSGAELALVDPKRAKRIWANRQSAARSKERKMRYIGELERNVQALQTEATSLNAQLTLMQSETGSLTSENSELKLRLQAMEQQVHLQDALNDALKEDLQRLTGKTGGPLMNFRANQQFYPSRNTLLTAQQFQQLQIQSSRFQLPEFNLHAPND